MLRLGGAGAIAGGLLSTIGFIAGNVFRDSPSTPLWFGVMAAGSFALLLALTGLSAYQARRNPRLTWAAFVIPAAGSIVTLIGVYGLATRPSDLPVLLGLSSWALWALGLVAMVLGSTLFAVATYVAAVLSRTAAAALAISSVALLFVALLGTFGLPESAPNLVFLAATVVAFGGSWTWLGIHALRRGPIRVMTAA